MTTVIRYRTHYEILYWGRKFGYQHIPDRPSALYVSVFSARNLKSHQDFLTKIECMISHQDFRVSAAQVYIRFWVEEVAPNLLP
jgi:hypothetical protein